MSDDDLIRRGDALEFARKHAALSQDNPYDTGWTNFAKCMAHNVASIPAVTPALDAALRLPEVAALVEAARRSRNYAAHSPMTQAEINIASWLDAALIALTGEARHDH